LYESELLSNNSIAEKITVKEDNAMIAGSFALMR